MSEAIARIFEGGRPLRLQAGEPLFHSGDPVRRMFRVVEGHILLARPTTHGADVVLQQAGSGEVVAEASAYAPHYHCDARALRPTHLQALPVERFRHRLAADPALAEAWAAHLARAVQAARLRAEIRTLRTVTERLDAWLEAGRALPAKGQWQDLAAELGVRREALYRELARRRRDPAAQG